MLAQPQLPTETRIAIREYAEQKSAGTYGHNSAQVRRFVAQIKSPVLDPQRSRARRVLDLEPRPAAAMKIRCVVPLGWLSSHTRIDHDRSC